MSPDAHPGLELVDAPGWDLSPQERAELEEALEQDRLAFERSSVRRCAFGHCTVHEDPVTGEELARFGPVGCGCDNLPGWDSRHRAGRPKPGWQVKAAGRHGGRIAASRRKRADLAQWQRELGWAAAAR